MKLNRKDLRKIQYSFNSISSRLLSADYNDHLNVLKRFISFLDNTSIIRDYIVDCGECTQDLDEEFRLVASSHGGFIFSTGETDEEEVRNVYAILKHIVEKDVPVHGCLAFVYSQSSKFADHVKGFNERLVMILIRHIECYLTNIGIDMGIDEKTIYNVTVKDGQAIIATDNAVVNASNTVSMNLDKLEALLERVRENAANLSNDDKTVVQNSLEAIKTEACSTSPRKSVLDTALTVLKGIKSSVEFSAAVASLVQFLSSIVS